MEEKEKKPQENLRPSTLRWKILRQALLPRHHSSEKKSEEASINLVSRKAKQGFNLIPCELSDTQVAEDSKSKDVCFSYSLPTPSSQKLLLLQRKDNSANIHDFEICKKYDIDNTGLVCPWPSEEVLSYYCLSHVDMFRSKRVIELGSGYGLAGLVIATVSEASEVVISDGNPQVMDYIQRSIAANPEAFGNTIVKPMLLHWNQEDLVKLSRTFDFIVASDCTFFKEFHRGLVRTVKSLLKDSSVSEAIFLSPKRGNSLDKFVEEIQENGLCYSISENYDERVWQRHQELMKGDDSWLNYEADHCYPLLLRISWK